MHTIDTHEYANIPVNPESSAVRFMESMRKKAEMLMVSGDIVERISKPNGGKKKVEDPKEEERLLLLAKEMREAGKSFSDIAGELPWSPESISEKLAQRGWHSRSHTKQSRSAKKAVLIGKAREVHDLRPLWTVAEATKKVGGITEDQYQRIRGELNLPMHWEK